MIRAGTKDHGKKCRKTHCRFEMSEGSQMLCSFSGFHVKNEERAKSIFEVDQLTYVVGN